MQDHKREPPLAFTVWNELYVLVSGSDVWKDQSFRENLEYLFHSFYMGDLCVFLSSENQIIGFFTVNKISFVMTEIGMFQSFQRGTGTLMIQYLKTLNMHLRLHSKPSAEGFWTKMGFCRTDENNRTIYEWKKT